MQSSSPGVFHVFRLHPHEDLKTSILKFAHDQKIKAGAIVSCVGSLEQVSIRFANKPTSFVTRGHFEILSLTGTLSSTSAHLHLAIADSEGRMLGGHLLENNLVFTTAEITVVSFSDFEFARELDPTYGYHELVVRPTSHEH